MKTSALRFAALAAMVCGFAAAAAAEEPKPVKYIQSFSSKYHFIDLEFPGRSGIEVESEMEWVSTPKDNCYLGARQTSSGDTRFFVFNYGSTDGWYYGYRKFYASKTKTVAGKRCVLNTLMMAGEQRMNVTADGVTTTVKTSAEAGDFNCGYDLYLFAANYYGSSSLWVDARCFDIKIWDYTVAGHEGERVLVRHYIPYLDGDGKPCLYEETTTQKFYYPGSTDKDLAYEEFPVKVKPDHYVEYIESDGSQYIDTHLHGGIGYRSLCDMSFVELPKDGCFLGSREASIRSYLCYYYSSSFCWGNGELVNLSPKSPAEVGKRYAVQMDMFTDSRYLFIDGARQEPGYTSSAASRVDASTYYVFALNFDGSATGPVKARCYGIKIWQSSTGASSGELTLVRDLHPCVDKDGVAGLFDAVDEIIYYKGAGNDFTVGPRIAEAGVVVKVNGSSAASCTPAAGTYDDLEEGKSYDYTSEARAYDEWMVYACSGYTTATSEDGSTWSDESALVDSRSCTHVFDSSWWRLTWQWAQAGYAISNNIPAGASVTYSPTPEQADGRLYYPTGTAVTMTASETDGGDGVFNCWASSLAGSVPTTNRTITVLADAKVFYTPTYSHPWTVKSEKGGIRTITDGVWDVELDETNVVGTITSPFGGRLDFTTVEHDLGFKIMTLQHFDEEKDRQGPANLLEFIGPDVTDAGNRCFQQCENLFRAVFSPNLRRVGRSSFYGCKNLADLTPDYQTFVNRADIAGDEHYAFSGCAKLLAGEDLVLSRRRPVTLPMSYFHGLGMKNADLSGCSKLVTPTVEALEKLNFYGLFAECASLETVTLPPLLDNLPREAFWGCSSLTLLRFTGVVPPPEKIGYFYGSADLKLVIGLPRALNPNIVADLQLREPTEQEMKSDAFPREAYEKGDFIGVWDQPTSGWGAPSSKFCRMWVVNMKAPSGKGMMLLIK